VTAIQEALKEKGHDPGPIDGIIGPRTRAALREFQTAEGMQATGQPDTNTLTALGVDSK
jgi:membrane-bound lytic murein transglycosylase B